MRLRTEVLQGGAFGGTVPFFVAGMSMGGMVAMELCEKLLPSSPLSYRWKGTLLLCPGLIASVRDTGDYPRCCVCAPVRCPLLMCAHISRSLPSLLPPSGRVL